MTELPKNPVAWLHALHMEQGQVSTRLTDWDCIDPDEPSWGAFGRPGRDYSEEYTVTTQPLYTHPPATDVAALVEAAKAMGDDYMTSEHHHPRYVLVPTVAFEQMRQALAPFTKGQNDVR